MPPNKPTAGRFVEVSLKIAKKKFPLVSEALEAVLALAGHQVSLEPKKPGAASPVSRAGTKAAPARTGRGRRAAAEKKPASPETAALIHDLRIKAGLSQRALAEKAGVSQNHISLLETGKQNLKPALAKKLGRLLKAPLVKED
ncbi:MAG: helix-turn-helix domain-containing protein [Candidatus Adiutrix sp.]|jgi:DNA-binding XRE family transcriptional regulator|nr:helix-turn-helix domain-containing protein [Candidatus Adiutrix sp.]